MEFRLNKIDTDIRRKLAKEVKEKEVNRKTRPEIDNKVKKPFVELDTEDKNDTGEYEKDYHRCSNRRKLYWKSAYW